VLSFTLGNIKLLSLDFNYPLAFGGSYWVFEIASVVLVLLSSVSLVVVIWLNFCTNIAFKLLSPWFNVKVFLKNIKSLDILLKLAVLKLPWLLASGKSEVLFTE